MTEEIHSLTYKWLVGVLLGVVLPVLAWMALETRAMAQSNAMVVARQQVLMEWMARDVEEGKLTAKEHRARIEMLERELSKLGASIPGWDK